MGHHDAALNKHPPTNNIAEFKPNIKIHDLNLQQTDAKKSVIDLMDSASPTDISPKRRLPFEVVLIAIIVAASFANAIALAIE